MVTFSGIKSKAIELRKRAVKAKNRLDTKTEQKRAKNLQRRSQAEFNEAARLEEKLTSLKKQEAHLKQREAIQHKKREIAELESRVTTKGRILASIGKQLNNLNKPKKTRKRRK